MSRPRKNKIASTKIKTYKTDSQQKGNKKKRGEHLAPYQWAKGQSGNPKGLTSGYRILGNIIRQQAVEVIRDKDGNPLLTSDGEQLNRLTAMLLAVWSDAIFKSDGEARRFLAERGWGKVPLPVVNIQETLNEFCEERGTNIGKLLPGDPGLSALFAAARIRGLVGGLPEGIEENGSTDGKGAGSNGIHRNNPPSDTPPIPDKK